MAYGCKIQETESGGQIPVGGALENRKERDFSLGPKLAVFNDQ